jgi:hypothetical protein
VITVRVSGELEELTDDCLDVITVRVSGGPEGLKGLTVDCLDVITVRVSGGPGTGASDILLAIREGQTHG